MNFDNCRNIDVQDMLVAMRSSESRAAFELLHPGFRASQFIAAVRHMHQADRSSLDFPAELRIPGEGGSCVDELITRFSLTPFFITQPERPWGIEPAAFDFTRGIVKAEEMKQWRARYRKCSQIQQVMIATLIWLCQEKTKDTVWLRRASCTWMLSAAAEVLSRKNALELWLILIIRGPGMQTRSV